jgi:hypothetical protein
MKSIEPERLTAEGQTLNERNDSVLAVLPIGVMVFSGTGIQDNLAGKARKMGIPVWTFGDGGA